MKNLNHNAIPHTLSAKEFAAVKKRTKRLYIYANSIIEQLLEKKYDSPFGILLFDEHGTILRIFGDSDFLAWTKKRKIKAGTNWSESHIGKNGFSFGIKQKGVSILNAEDCAASFFADMTTYFVPISLERKAPYGGLALITAEKSASDLQSTLLLSIARGIELMLFWFGEIGMYGDITEGSGMVCLDQSDNKNYILTMSDEISKILKLPSEDYYYTLLEEIIPDTPENAVFWSIVNEQKQVQDRTVRITIGDDTIVVNISTSPFHEKKFHMSGIAISINSIGRINKLISKYAGNAAHYTFRDFIGGSSVIRDMLNRARNASHTDSNVLIMGESGVGKELIAQAIHNSSERSSKPFVAINCASLSKELIASELFGYESGAFTGAKKSGGVGKFELANHGTLFLDEIGDMPPDLQAHLLRVLEERCFRKVGGNEVIQVDVRIIAATNQNLRSRARHGLFREDLLYRLGIIRIHVPPLRERGKDTLLLADYFMKHICERLGKEPVQLAKNAANFLLNYDWPGNARELQNLLEGIIGTTETSVIDESEIRIYLNDCFFVAATPAKATESAPRFDPGSSEEEQILQTLKVCRNNKTRAADALGMSRSTFYRRLKELKICTD